MLFDPRPKQEKRDLFGRERELNRLLAAMGSRCPLILLLGVRRIGKTSLLKVALKEAGQPYIYLDLRILEEEGYSRVALYRLLSEELSRLHSAWKRLGEFVRKVRGVEIAGVRIELDWGSRGLMLSSLLKALNEWVEREKKASYLTLALDEAQLLRNMVGGKGRIDFRSLLAYSYDNLPNLKFILTGSEVGLLMDFVGAENPASPLYGRYREEIVLEGFDDETALSFLEKGFREQKLKVERELLEEAVRRLDGVVGWLAYYGYRVSQERKPNGQLLNAIFEEAKAMASKELEKIFQRSRYYRLVLRALGMGEGSWASIKRSVEAWTGKPVGNAQITRLLENLVKLGIIRRGDRGYQIVDPIIREAAKHY